METNIALGLFVNSTQLLFRVMGAPPCHNNSLKEEQFNVNNILSICLLMKTSQSTGKMFLPLQKEKHNRKREHQAGIAVKGVALARLNESFWWHRSICSLLHFSKGCRAFRYFDISMQFSQGTPRSGASWLICMATSWVKWRYSTCQAALFWGVWSLIAHLIGRDPSNLRW